MSKEKSDVSSMEVDDQICVSGLWISMQRERDGIRRFNARAILMILPYQFNSPKSFSLIRFCFPRNTIIKNS
ncbi:hypothetical protein L1887_14642 [Cichorium endivia]|nr:hypothetical protein L1887_14642 [Cichorium endivia]